MMSLTFYWPTPHGADHLHTVPPPDPTPNQACHRDIEHTGWPGLWAGAGHLGSGTRVFWRDADDQDKDSVIWVLTESPWLMCDLFVRTSVQFWGRSGWRWSGDEGEAGWAGYWFQTLPKAERGKLRDRQWTHLYPSHRSVPTTLNGVAPTWPWGSPAVLQGPHRTWGFECGTWTSRRTQSQCMSDLLAEYNLIYLVHHFQYRSRFGDLETWSQVQPGTVLRLRCNYILGKDRRRFDLVGIQDMRIYSSDYFVLRARLQRRPNRCHTLYLQGSRADLMQSVRP